VTAVPGKKIRVLIVDDLSDTRENVRKLLLFERDIEVAGAAADGHQAIEAARQLKPDVILMDINMPGMDGIAAAQAITGQMPQSQVIMMSVQGEADYLRRSMLAGAREFLIKPFTGDELVDSVRRVFELGLSRKQVGTVLVQQTESSAPAPAARDSKGKIVAVFSPKGGTGRTTVAANLAVALGATTGKRIALVDGNLPLGDIGVVLNLQSKKSIVDLITASGELDSDLMDGVLQTHSSGVRVLLAPPRPEMAELVTPEILRKVLEHLRDEFDYVVVDTWTSFQDQVLAVLDIADRILLLMTSEIHTIKNIRLFLELAEALGYPAEKVVLVLNRTDSRGGIGMQDIQQSINHPIAAGIVNDRQLVMSSVNRGVPFAVGQKDSQVSRDVHDVAKLLAASMGNGHKPKNGAGETGLVGRLLGRK
jgi:pilus assembly protein CpaE